jgi:hypothetical protein
MPDYSKHVLSCCGSLPDRARLTIHLKTAKVPDLAVPPSLIARAAEVIE